MRVQAAMIVANTALVASYPIPPELSLELHQARPTRHAAAFVSPTTPELRHRCFACDVNRHRSISASPLASRSSSSSSSSSTSSRSIGHRNIPRWFSSLHDEHLYEASATVIGVVESLEKNANEAVQEQDRRRYHRHDTQDNVRHGDLYNDGRVAFFTSQPTVLPEELVFVAQTAGVVAVALVFLGLVPSDAVAVTASVGVSVPIDLGAVFAKAGKASLGGGVSGAAAAVVQVLSLMWLRTTMNFQYKNGGSTQQALQTLWEEGGITRLYRGLPFALVQGPLSRFGDTAANVGVLVLLEAFEETRGLPLPVKSAAGSLAAGLWRIGLTPIDTYKTTLQVSGAEGVSILAAKVSANGPSVLFEGALATATATFIGHYPWYFTYNALGAWLPVAPPGDALLKLGRQAFLGLCSSCVSDCCSNSVRVVKTTKQTAPAPISYPEAFKQVIDKDGVAGLFLRGLQTRILVNALQGALFAVAWKYFEGVLKTGL